MTPASKSILLNDGHIDICAPAWSNVRAMQHRTVFDIRQTSMLVLEVESNI